jgi:hypothetical protein
MGRRWGILTLLVLLATLALPAMASGAAPGQKIWLHTTGAHVQWWTVSMAVSAGTGDVYVAGTRSMATDAGDFLIARYRTSGARKWVHAYDRGGVEKLADIAADRRGNVIACGTQGNDKAILLVKYSPAGRVLWKRQVRQTGARLSAAKIVVDGRDRIFVAGAKRATSAAVPTAFLVKYTAGGIKSWQRTYRSVAGATQLELGPDGRLYLAGVSIASGRSDLVGVVCYTRTGVRRWTAYLGHKDRNDSITDLRVKKNGICGAGQYGGTYFQGLVFRMTLDGKLQYATSIPTPDDTDAVMCYACDMDDAGRVVAGGYFDEGYAVWRFDLNGRIADRLEIPVLADAWDVAVSGAGDVFSAGWVDHTSTAHSYDAYTHCLTAAWLPAFPPVEYASSTGGPDVIRELALARGCFYEAGASDGHLLLARYAR